MYVPITCVSNHKFHSSVMTNPSVTRRCLSDSVYLYFGPLFLTCGTVFEDKVYCVECF